MYHIYAHVLYIHTHIYTHTHYGVESKYSWCPLYIDYGVVVPWSSSAKSQYSWVLKKEALQNIC